MLSVLIARWQARRAQQRHAEIVFAANLAIREIKRRAISELLDRDRRSPVARYGGDSTVIEGTAVEIDQP